MSGPTQTHLKDVRTISVPVSDQQRALEFYTGKLGLETRMDVAFGDGQRWIEVAVPGAETAIALSSPDPEGLVGVDTGIRFRTGDAQSDYEGFKARGIAVEGDLMRWPDVPPMFMFRDPDGNLLYVVEDAVQTERSTGRPKRFAVLVKSSTDIEEGAMPTEDELAAMTRFNDDLVASGAMLAGEGFLASVNGARLTFAGRDVSVQRGPFSDPESLVAGYWIIQAVSLDEAIELMKSAPVGGGTLEIRQVADADDFGEEFTPELREREDRQRDRVERNARRRAA